MGEIMMKSKDLKQILVPVDGSKESISACRWATTIAEATGASITLLHVVDLNEKMTSFDRVSMSGYIPEVLRLHGQEMLDQYLSHMPKTITIHPQLRAGSPHQTIAQVAKELRPDWILMGSRGASNLREIVMGSVSQYVLHHVSCPVMIIKDETEEA